MTVEQSIINDIKNRLDKVFMGDENEYRDLRKDLAFSPRYIGKWTAYNTLHYLLNKTKETEIASCSPEALIDLTYMIVNFRSDLTDQYRAKLLEAINSSNDGVKAALLLFHAHSTLKLEQSQLVSINQKLSNDSPSSSLSTLKLFCRGMIYFIDRNYQNAAENFEKASENSNFANAMYNFALMYIHGKAGKDLTQEQRDKKAQEWFEKAADLGFKNAKDVLAKINSQKSTCANNHSSNSSSIPQPAALPARTQRELDLERQTSLLQEQVYALQRIQSASSSSSSLGSQSQQPLPTSASSLSSLSSAHHSFFSGTPSNIPSSLLTTQAQQPLQSSVSRTSIPLELILAAARENPLFPGSNSSVSSAQQQSASPDASSSSISISSQTTAHDKRPSN